MSFLVMISEILELFVDTLAVNDKYFLRNRGNLPQPILMQLSNKQITFSRFLAPVFKSTWRLKHVEKRMTLIAYLFWKLQTVKYVVKKCLKSPVSEHPLTVNMLEGPKRCWNLHDSIFIIFCYHSEGNRVRKCLL